MLRLVFTMLVIAVVLLGPVLVEAIDRNVEVFFLLAGVLTACVMGQFNTAMVGDALSEPLPFTLAVFFFGAVFRLLRDYFDRLLTFLIRLLDPPLLCFSLSIVLGFLAALITPVVSALMLVEAISLLHCNRRAEIAATVFGCFAIGFGAGLTPLGMPGISVLLRSLHADFWYLARLLGPFVAVGVFLAAVPSLFLSYTTGETLHPSRQRDSWRLVLWTRPSKVFVFIAGLVALCDGLRPTVDAYIHHVPSGLLFWMNTVSAVLNNSTLAVLEIGPALSISKQRAAMLGLLVSGGALIPGNIPNIVAANRLRISSREWARIGIVTTVLFLVACFIVLTLMSVLR